MESRIDMRTARYKGVAFMFAILAATVAMGEVPEAILKQAWYPKAPPLPKPAGQVIRVSSVDDIYRAAKNLQPGSRILVADAHYMADHTRDCKIISNTVHDPKNRMRRPIRVIHANDGLVVKNNIFSGPGVSIERYTGKIDIDATRRR